MSNQEILEKAIQKAIDGGWSFMDYSKAKDKWRAFKRDFRIEEDGIYSKGGYECLECFRPAYSIDEIIYDHDFAKALWAGEPAVRIHGDAPVVLQPAWQYHLQQMVIADDPIKYLGENL